MNAIKLSVVVLISLFLSSWRPITDAKPTIVIVDGKAILADVDNEGKVITTYMEVPEYFESAKPHDIKVEEAKQQYERLSSSELDQIRFIVMLEEGQVYDEFMVANIDDLVGHYRNTYANQIEITAARRGEKDDFVTKNVNHLKTMLMLRGIYEDDIKVKYRIDMGTEPIRFLKVASNLKALASD